MRIATAQTKLYVFWPGYSEIFPEDKTKRLALTIQNYVRCFVKRVILRKPKKKEAYLLTKAQILQANTL